MLKRIILLVLITTPIALWAQTETVADKIIGVVGNKIVLQSDIDLAYDFEPVYKNVAEDTAKCSIAYELIAQQMLVEEAARDSVIVSDDEVEKQIDDKIQSFIAQYGSREALEKASGQSVYQLKQKYKTFFGDQLTAQKMQQQLIGTIKITPSEVKSFFDDIAKSDLPLMPATFEMGQLIIAPKISDEIETLAKEKLEGIRKEIVADGRDFATMASIYSDDPSRNNGGLISINRKGVDPKFGTAAFRLQPGEVSPVVRSRFGYHIIQMVKKMGDDAQVRHILIIPQVTSVSLGKTKDLMDSIRTQLVAGKITFSKAVGEYSTDDASKMTAGMILDPQTGSSSLEVSRLQDPDAVKAATDLKVGEFSEPQIYRDPRTQQQEIRILYLKSRTEPHQLSLADDYSLIQSRALQKKQNEFLADWVRKKSKEYYINIDDQYKTCPAFKDWDLK